MTSSPTPTEALPFAVYGAYGYTGRLVARELTHRGLSTLLLGRAAEPLEQLAQKLGDRATYSVAPLKEPDRLSSALDGVAAVINCAGPFAVTGESVVSAALRAGCHYVDVAAEPPFMRHLFESYQATATAARTAVVPAAGFYFAISDCLVCLSGAEVDSPGRVTVAYAVEDWRMTRASRETALALSGGERLGYSDGKLRAVRAGAEVSEFSFPPPLGQQQVLAYPGGEVLTVPRHTPVEEVRVVMTASTFNQATFTSEDISAAERAQSRFTVFVEIESPSATYTRTATGCDIYGLAALTAVEVSVDLVARAGNAPVGVLAPAEAVDAGQLLERLPRALLVTDESMTAR